MVDGGRQGQGHEEDSENHRDKGDSLQQGRERKMGETLETEDPRKKKETREVGETQETKEAGRQGRRDTEENRRLQVEFASTFNDGLNQVTT